MRAGEDQSEEDISEEENQESHCETVIYLLKLSNSAVFDFEPYITLQISIFAFQSHASVLQVAVVSTLGSSLPLSLQPSNLSAPH